ncbi:MBL fold metallo-hydrolase [Persephonella sp.]
MKLKENKLTVLGAYGSRYDDMHPSTFLINNSICIDGGNILEPLKEKSFLISDIFLTHSHLDHICDIPFLIDITYTKRKKPLNIYGLPETINALKEYILNCEIWPDFSNINLIHSESKSVRYIEIDYFKEICIGDIRIKPIPANHSIKSCGFVVNNKILISGDTYSNKYLVNEINSNKSIEMLFIDVSFPARLDNIAEKSKHHSTRTLKEEIKKLRDNIKIYAYHIKPPFSEEIKKELKDEKINFLKEGNIFYFL